MRFNWGYKITAFYLVFVIGIMYLVIQSSRQKIDLVTPDYYAMELKHQQRIDESNRAASLSQPLGITIKHDVLNVQFPDEFRGKTITGEVLIYCPANKNNDISRTISVTDNSMNISIPEKNSGMHEVQVSWAVNGLTYYSSKSLFIP